MPETTYTGAVWKYPIPVEDQFLINMPSVSTLLYVAVQNGKPYLWAHVCPETHIQQRAFRLAGTGHPLPPPTQLMPHVGSFMLHDGALVFHLFENVEANAGKFRLWSAGKPNP